MSLIDALTVGTFLILALARLIVRSPAGKAWWFGLAAAATLAVVQLASEGLYWQLVTSYLLLAVVIALAALRQRSARPVVLFASRSGLGLLIIAAMVP